MTSIRYEKGRQRLCFLTNAQRIVFFHSNANSVNKQSPKVQTSYLTTRLSCMQPSRAALCFSAQPLVLPVCLYCGCLNSILSFHHFSLPLNHSLSTVVHISTLPSASRSSSPPSPPLPHSEALLPVFALAQLLPTTTHQCHQEQSGLKIKNGLVIKEACCHDKCLGDV